MRHTRPLTRALIVAAIAVSMLGATGCKWFRKGSELYAQSPESRPLEVPPDLSLPNTAGASQVPALASAARATQAAQPAQGGFTASGSRDEVFGKVGVALESISGVNIASRAKLLGSYDVAYEGSDFLVRVVAVDAGAYVSAVDPRGLPATGEAAVKLIDALKAKLVP